MKLALITALLLAPWSALHAAAAPTKRTNLIVIPADDMVYGEPGSYGGKLTRLFYTIPRRDSIAGIATISKVQDGGKSDETGFHSPPGGSGAGSVVPVALIRACPSNSTSTISSIGGISSRAPLHAGRDSLLPTSIFAAQDRAS